MLVCRHCDNHYFLDESSASSPEDFCSEICEDYAYEKLQYETMDEHDYSDMVKDMDIEAKE